MSAPRRRAVQWFLSNRATPPAGPRVAADSV
ncbi:hypothetical protein DR64_962 [Paraburkholderia xenovorans LB400]|jgi:hypothetical protein|nr:hypothetical protein DR64_962 [Paraburkholderia xenovorans LB400]